LEGYGRNIFGLGDIEDRNNFLGVREIFADSKRLATATVIKLKDEDDSNFDESDSDLDNNK
jgi:hypothetical protein